MTWMDKRFELEPPKDRMSELVGDSIDKLINMDMSARGIIGALYEAARKKFGRSLTLLAAEKLIENVHPEDSVIIATGFPCRWWVNPNIGENDGPPGAAALARSLLIGLRALPVIIQEEGLIPLSKAACIGAGLAPVDFESAKKAFKAPTKAYLNYTSPYYTCTLEGFPIDRDKAKEAAKRMIDQKNPKAIITIEKPGPNIKGIIHHGPGYNIDKYTAKIGYLIKEAREKGILTIGIGDGGNEYGMGTIWEEAHEIVDKMRERTTGAMCWDGCGGGIIDSTVMDVLVTACVSNWGAYGISAMLSYLLRNEIVLHNEEIEKRILWECSRAGGMSGGLFGWSGFLQPAPDTTPARINGYVIELMRTLVAIWRCRLEGTSPPY